ncbi:PREDICTED: feruloyl CoA ortho-hydroxylase 1-like [Tarenaya hassleriana]|uniref:feruloyl CoA ortho-hydroxylase 1-like n=1 Tax=Tarenaya hassleriana TaxID=28532 RepID=UPI00053C808A|nr:PREDICTED: feruloyl CoA ortho-hydroxylase 1-like [Tarenaya hassleriana]
MAPTMATQFSDPAKVTDFVVKKGNGVKGLSETGIKALPDQYIQPLEERLINQFVKLTDESIPVIDMSDSDQTNVAKAVCDAAEKWGFFQVVNHGVPLEVLESVKMATHRFFGLPVEEKRKFLAENSPSRTVRFGTSFSPHAEKALEWKDYLSLFFVSEAEASQFWPHVCRDEALEYMNETKNLVRKILEMLVKKLNVKEMESSMFMGSIRVNLNYYPICPNPDLTVGVGRHSDVSSLTILLQDDIGGLHVRSLATGNWVHVAPIPGSLVINIGDAMQIMSNGRYKSVEHRVLANGGKNRISVPIFVNPKPSSMIGPLSELISGGGGEEPLYKNVLYSDYVRHFFKKAHDGKKTVDFAKI